MTLRNYEESELTCPECGEPALAEISHAFEAELVLDPAAVSICSASDHEAFLHFAG